jgi:hypothetical protein
MMAVWKLVGWRGAIAIVLLLALGISHLQTRHWKSEAGKERQAYLLEKQAFDTTVASYRLAAQQAAESDRLNKQRVEAAAAAINERTAHDYETRLAAARAAAGRLQSQPQANSGSANKPAVPGISNSASGADPAAAQSGLSIQDRLIATEQAIQLDELIKWIKSVGQINTQGADNGMVTTNSTRR